MNDFRKKFILATSVVGFIIFLVMAGSIFETNDKGKFQVKQAAVTGTMSVRTTPGMYVQWFGDITTWDKNSTFFFTADGDEGENYDESIEVRFVDGSIANISGTMRISLPKSPAEILNLIDTLGFTSFAELESKLIKPTVRNALRLTANFMTARESYADKRADYNTWAWDQIQNGLYKTKDVKREAIDPTTGKMAKKIFKEMMKNKDGSPIYTKNPLAGTGIRLSNFEVKKFVYEEKVNAQISKQQELYMSIATAKAEAAKAQQDKLKEEAKGKANVAKAEAIALVLKKEATVEAEQQKEVAVTKAKKKYEVAKFAAKEALEEAKRVRAVGAAKAAANQALVKAGLTPLQRANIQKETAIGVAKALSATEWPKIMTFGGGKSGKMNPLDAVGYNQMFDLVNKMSTTTGK